MTDCPYCPWGTMFVCSDKNAVFKKDGISVRYERMYMACDKCGEETQTNAQATASTRNALEAYHNRRELIVFIFVCAVMAIVVTSIFVRCS